MSKLDDVVCQNCKVIFKGEGTSAYQCACSVFKGHIYGHYGSKYDIQLLKAPGLPNMDPICDACIDILVAKGLATYEREYIDFDEQDVSRRPN